MAAYLSFGGTATAPEDYAALPGEAKDKDAPQTPPPASSTEPEVPGLACPHVHEHVASRRNARQIEH